MTADSKPIKAKRKPAQRGATPKKVLGSTKPRLQSPSLKTKSRIDEVADLAIKIGMPLLPWQHHVLSDMLSVSEDNNFIRKSNLLLCARQVGKTHLARMRILAGLFIFDSLVVAEGWIARPRCPCCFLEEYKTFWQEKTA